MRRAHGGIDVRREELIENIGRQLGQSDKRVLLPGLFGVYDKRAGEGRVTLTGSEDSS